MKITNEKQQYYGLDLLKFIMAVLVAARHVIQIYYKNSAASSTFPETGTYSKGIFALSYP